MLYNIVKSKLKKQEKIYSMSEDDCTDLGELLRKGYPLNDALLIINKKYQFLIDQLEKGESIISYFNQQKSFYFKTICLFTRFTSLPQSIQAANGLKKIRQSLQKQLFTQCSYPIMILIFSVMIFIFFESFIYPQISMLIEIENMMFHELLFILVRVLLIILCLGVVVLMTMMFYLIIHPEKKKQMFVKIALKIPIIRKLLSYQFTTYLITLIRQGFSTQQIITSLNQSNINQTMNWILEDMTYDFELGKNWISIVEDSIYFDEKFIYFFKMGYHLSDLNTTLCDYLEFQKQDFIKTIRYFSILMTTISYGSIACLVITIYQVILLPLEMIERI